MAHTTRLQPWEVRLVQHLVVKPLQRQHKYTHGDRARWYRTIDLPSWRDAYNYLGSMSFLKGHFNTLVWVDVASHLHGLSSALGPLRCMHRCQCMWALMPNGDGASCPML